MMKWFYFVYFFFLTTLVSYSQTYPIIVSPHFTELKGMEDYNNNTNLLFRIYSSFEDYYNYNSDNSIHLLNVITKEDSIFQRDGGYSNYYTGGFSRGVSAYDFWENNPRKFIVCGVESSGEAYPFVEKFDMPLHLHTFFGEATFIGISRQKDSLVYCTFISFTSFSDILFKSTTEGMTWDTAGYFNAVSLSPYNDKVLFAYEKGKLYKTIDGGLTKNVVDSIPNQEDRTNSLIYDKDSNYIYRTAYFYSQGNSIYKFLVSNNSGNAYSWEIKYTSSLPIYVTVDNAIAGSVYLATGKYIYYSADFGSSFSLLKSFDRKLVGIYKKPGSNLIYTATNNILYEINGSAVTILKQIPVDPEIFKFDPIDIGNKWVYSINLPWKSLEYKEVVKDTLLANQKIFRQIKQIYIDSVSRSVSYSYERIDSVTGNVYGWASNSTEYIMDNLNLDPGDTIYVSRFNPSYGETIFDSLKSISLFNMSIDTRIYTVETPVGRNHYYLAKNFGMSYLEKGYEAVLTVYELKGAVIKGIVYGDTSTVVGINDKDAIQPKEFVLSQNYPNPFNPSTRIKFTIPVNKTGLQKTRLMIYNLLGREVAVLINEDKGAGSYELEFDASKYGLSSGIYFYRLTSGSFDKTMKMIYLK